MSLWDIAIQHNRSEEKASSKGFESTVIFIGSKGSGKTSIIYRLLDKTENTKPTVALEYFFGRRARNHNTIKDVAHIWELGGGTWLAKLLETVINPDNIESLCVALVLDLSKPEELWHTVESLLKIVRARVGFVLEKMKEERLNPELLSWPYQERVENHSERELLLPFPVPLMIIGGKFDKFLELESVKKNVVCSTLRFLSHYYGASLQFFTPSQETLITRTKGILSHYLFNTSEPKQLQIDKNSPLSVPAGMDSFQDIGEPITNNSYDLKAAKNPLWKNSFFEMIPQKKDEQILSNVADPAKDPQYREDQVDTARLKKDEELERYKRGSERKMRDLMQLAINEGIIIV